MPACSSSFHPSGELRVLLLGEGNVSFTYALVKKITKSSFFRRYPAETSDGAAGGTPEAAVELAAASARVTEETCLCRVYATTFDSEAELAQKYPESEPFLRYFSEKTRVRVTYHGGVNATDLVGTLPSDVAREEPFHLVYFNNPHIGIEDQYRHHALLAHTFDAIRTLNSVVDGSRPAAAPPTHPPRQVVIALCDAQPQRWALLEAAASNGFVCVAAVPVLAKEFPQFTNRRHQSDAAFPYEHMVQYYFVPATDLHTDGSDECHAVWLAELQTVFEAFEAPRGQLSLESWRKALRGLHVAGVDRASPTVTEAAPADSPRGDVEAVNAQWRGPLAVPLLHPRLAFHHDGSGATGNTWYSPYLDLATLPARYRAQLAEEQRQETLPHDAPNGGLTTNAFTVSLPPQLDERVLGRPLTQREQVKRQRFITKATQSHRAEANVGTSYVCPHCEPARHFASEDALVAHTRSQHSGVDQLFPTHQARVHTQIRLDAPDSAAADPDKGADAAAPGTDEPSFPSSEAFCRVCDLQFTSRAAYEEHLRFLSPSAVRAEASATAPDVVTADGLWACRDCTPPRVFHDARALVQHRTLKHPAAPAPALA